MAAGEDEAQPVVLDRILGGARGIRRFLGLQVLDRVVGPADARGLAQRVDALEACRGDEPGARVLRHAVARPLLDGRRERFLHRLLRAVEVPEQADQRREHPPRFLAPDRLDARPGGIRVGTGQMRGSTGRTSIVPADAQRRDAPRDLERLVHVAALDDVEAAELLLGLGIRAVGDDAPAALHPQRLRVAGLQASFSVARCWPARSRSATQAP